MFSFPKNVRLRHPGQFQRVFRSGTKFVGEYILVQSYSQEGGTFKSPRLGISVSKKYGKAVERNRFKRIVREAFRRCRLKLPQSTDLNIRPRTKALTAKRQDVEAELLSFYQNSSASPSVG
jgi:ribonuclease P protein component